MRLLLVEDHVPLADELLAGLQRQGYAVDWLADGRDALYQGSSEPYDLIILDLGLPGVPGLEVLAQWRAGGLAIPVLILTARDSWAERIEGLKAGADDYLTKPFDLTELLLRCQALARRYQLHQSQTICIGDLQVNEKQQYAQRQGQTLKLSSTDFSILLALVQAYPNAVSRQQLINKIWGDEAPDSDVIRSHIYTLRQALDKPFKHAMLTTLHGIGFKLEAKD